LPVLLRPSAEPSPLVIQQMTYNDRKAIQGLLRAFRGGLFGDDREHVEPRHLCGAPAGLPSVEPPLIARDIFEERSRSAKQQGQDSEPKDKEVGRVQPRS